VRAGEEPEQSLDEVLAHGYATGNIKSLVPAMPALLRLGGEPYTLQDYLPMHPVFRLDMPPSTVIKAGRQISKSTALAALDIILHVIPHFHTLYVAPRGEQSKKQSTERVDAFLHMSPIKALLQGGLNNQSVGQKNYAQQAKAYYTNAYLDCGRTRGISSDFNMFDEVDDISSEFFKIINETLAASRYAVAMYTGTPTTTDAPLQYRWERSSQGEWVIPCQHHSPSYWNICRVDQDLLKMLKPQGLCCTKCGRELDTRLGQWVHAYPERVVTEVGYHMPQVIFPLHCEPDPVTGSRRKWVEIMQEFNSGEDRTLFYNEKLGEAFDTRVTLITLPELRRASGKIPLLHNTLNTARARIRQKGYVAIGQGIDWGGNGISGVSLTAQSVLGFLPDLSFDVLYTEKLTGEYGHGEEAERVRLVNQTLNCGFLAHDFAGAGGVRETLLLQGGFNPRTLYRMVYASERKKGLVTYTDSPPRGFYIVDKPRAITFVLECIRRGLIRFPVWEYWEQCANDFTSLREARRSSTRGSNIYLIDRKPSRSDDVVHSVVYAALAYWHSQQRYPNLTLGKATSSVSTAVANARGVGRKKS